MNAMNETSLTKAADPVSVFMSSNCSRHSGSVAFNGLEKGRGMLTRELVTCLECGEEWVKVFIKLPNGEIKSATRWFGMECQECGSANVDVLGYEVVARG